MSRTRNFAAVCIALFVLATFSDSASNAFARSNGGHGRSGHGVSRNHGQRNTQRRVTRTTRGANSGRRNQRFGNAGYGSYVTYIVPVQTGDSDAAVSDDTVNDDAVSDTTAADSDDATDVAGDDGADQGTVGGSQTYFGFNNARTVRTVHRPVGHRFANKSSRSAKHSGHASRPSRRR